MIKPAVIEHGVGRQTHVESANPWPQLPTTAEYSRAEILTGITVLVGVLYLVYMAIPFIGWAAQDYLVYADFASASGVYVGDPVEIAGVNVGRVESISLADDRARVGLRIKDGVTIQQDAVAAIKIESLLGGDRLVSIEPGQSAKTLAPGETIKKTRSPRSLQDLVGNLVAGNVL